MPSDIEEFQDRKAAGDFGLRAQIRELESRLRYIPVWLDRQRRAAAKERAKLAARITRLKKRMK
jgi:hypothetical protein